MSNSSMPSELGFIPGRVVVVGSLNIDRFLRVAHLPRPGETIFSTGAQQAFGGKGANQAVAAARFGAAVSLIGAVGVDAEGRIYRKHLVDEQVAIDWLATLPDVATGTAFISVDARGENQIIVDRGANGMLEAAHVTAALAALLPSTDVMLVGLESPLDAAVAAVALGGGDSPAPAQAAAPPTALAGQRRVGAPPRASDEGPRRRTRGPASQRARAAKWSLRLLPQPEAQG
jgi:ribokinase